MQEARRWAFRVIAFVLVVVLPAGRVLHGTERVTGRRDRQLHNIHLEVTVQQREDGTLSSGFHLLNLFCWNGQCSLTTLSLNQCGPTGDGSEGFYPKIERATTQDGDLRVTALGTSTLLAEETTVDIGGESKVTYRFTYDPEVPYNVTSFSGGFVKHSSLQNRVITVEYVPLVGRMKPVPLNCPPLLPGVISNR